MNFFSLIKNEFRVIFTSFAIALVIVGGNIFYAFFYPSPYLNDVVFRQKIAFVDEDKSALSRQFYFYANANFKLNLNSQDSIASARKMLENNEIFGILYIPKDFEKKALTAALPEVYYIANNAYFLIYGTIIDGLNNAASELKNDILTNRAKWDLSSDFSLQKGDLIIPNFIALFNANLGYLNYILAVVLLLILHQTIIIAIGILSGIQYQQFSQHKDFSDKNKFYFLNANPFSVILARVVAFFSIYFLIFLFYFGFIYSFYELNLFAKSLEILAFGAAFLVSSICFGAFLALLFSRREFLPQIAIVMSMPLLFSLGVFYPNIPFWLSFLMDFIPLKPSVDGFLKLNQMGADFSFIWGDFLHLILLAILYFFAALWVFKRRFGR